MIKILLVDDHALVRSGMCRMLEGIHGIEVIGQASTGQACIQFVRESRPNVVILDFRLPDISGLEVTTRLLRLYPNIKILTVTGAVNDLFPFRVLDAGAHGYLTKDATQEEFLQAIKSVHAGGRVISPEIASRLALAKIDVGKNERFSGLADRELEVMMMVIRGVSVKEIAERLFLSPKTVHSYRSRIFEKLNVDNEVALTLLTIREGLITLEEA